MLDFKALRESASMAEVLARCRIVHLRPLGHEERVGACPLHHGDNPAAFRVNLRRGLWRCFTRCGGGNVLDLVARMENVSVYEAGLRLQAWQGTAQPHPETAARVPSRGPARELRFRLTLAPHPYLTVERRLTPDTCGHFGVGFCSRGILRGCIAIPVHDHQSRLVAYVGRQLHPVPGTPKYRVPAGFTKSDVLFNACRLPRGLHEVIVVEGFFDVFALHQAGFPNVAALMGCTASEPQLRWLLDSGSRVAIMLDGDPAGLHGEHVLAAALDRHGHPYRGLTLGPGLQPENLSPAQLRSLLQP
jgi:DNA primase